MTHRSPPQAPQKASKQAPQQASEQTSENAVPDPEAPNPPDAPDDLMLQRLVARQMENAAIHGLCRDGQEDIGADLVRQHRPDWPDGAVKAFVRHVMKAAR